jgi:hypothetical protein
MKMNCQLHDLATSPPGEMPLVGDWVDQKWFDHFGEEKKMTAP